MVRRAVLIWILGLVTLVPWSVYRLLFIAERNEYAMLIVLPLFWIFGYWGVVGPILTLLKARRVLHAMQQAASAEELRRVVSSPEAQDAAIELIASENHLPEFAVRWAWKRFLLPRLPELTERLITEKTP